MFFKTLPFNSFEFRYDSYVAGLGSAVPAVMLSDLPLRLWSASEV